MAEPVRLAKRVVELARCSRSEAEQYIEEGWVLVDGKVVERPQHMVSDEKVELAPGAVLTPSRPATIVLHRAAGAEGGAASIAPDARWADDASGVRMLQRHRVRLAPIFPLEDGASGLCVLTQDRHVARFADDAGPRLEQEYVVEVTGHLASDGLRALSEGRMSFEGRPVPPCKVSWQSENRLRFALKAPRPGQMTEMCREVGLAVVGLRRLRVGRVSLARMPVGAWRYLGGERF